MPKIKDYKIVSGNTLDNLETNVIEFLQMGWYPIGGLHTFHGIDHCQAMVLPWNFSEDAPQVRKVRIEEYDSYDSSEDIPF